MVNGKTGGRLQGAAAVGEAVVGSVAFVVSPLPSPEPPSPELVTLSKLSSESELPLLGHVCGFDA